MDSYYDKYRSLYGGALVLYTVKSHNKPNWNARIKLPGRKGYIRRSLKTTLEEEAISLGSNLYLKLRAKQDQGLPVNLPKIQDCWKEYLTWREASGWKTYHAEKYWRLYGEEFFSQFERMDEITQKVMDGYLSKDGYRLNWAATHEAYLKQTGPENYHRPIWVGRNRSDDPAYTTMRGEISVLRSWFQFCKDRGYMGVVPILNNPMEMKQRIGSNRGCFSLEQYRALVKEIRRRCNSDNIGKPYTYRGGRQLPGRKNPYSAVSNERLRTWILLLAATGLRPQEAVQLRWRMIKKYERPESEFPYFTMIDLPADIAKAKRKGRRQGREVFSFDGNLTYDRLMNRWRPLCATPDDNDLIFPARRNTDKTFDFSTPFRLLLETMPDGPMLYDEFGLRLSSYSLRHFYVTQRITANVPLTAIAKNCGHQVSTLELVYNRLLARNMVDVLTMTSFDQHRRQVKQEESEDI